MRLVPLVRQLTIRTKRGTLEPFRPNWAQREFLAEIERQLGAGRPVRIVVLKARQLGISTATEAVLFWRAFLVHHSFGLVIAHEQDASEHLIGMTRLYWDTFPFKPLFHAKYHSKREIAWTETGSSVRIATAANVGAGRARTIQALHASEVAFWDFPDEIMLGMRQTIPTSPGSIIVLESTANGVGNWFHETWMAAEQGEVEYVPMFFPWWRHPEYSASGAGLSLPDLGKLDSEERALRKLGVDDDHLAWRRWAIANLAGGKTEDFHQEYPSTPEEAFVTSGANMFPPDRLRDCYEAMPGGQGRLIATDDGVRLRFVPDPTGPLTIFRQPSKDLDWGQYFVGGDPAHAGGGDYACAQVINRRMYEQVAVWHGKIDPISFADELVKIARYYNDAEIAPEVEGPGYATIGRLVSLDYPHLWRHRWADRPPGKIAPMFGWSTNWKRKDWMLAEVGKLIIDGSLTIHDRRTYEEFRNYTILKDNAYGPADPQGHDDCVMALGIAVVCARTEGPLAAFESRELRDRMEPPPAWATWEEG